MSRERKRNREATLERYQRQRLDPDHEARYQSWLKGWLGDAYRPPSTSVGPLDDAVDREMRLVSEYNRAP